MISSNKTRAIVSPDTGLTTRWMMIDLNNNGTPFGEWASKKEALEWLMWTKQHSRINRLPMPNAQLVPISVNESGRSVGWLRLIK